MRSFSAKQPAIIVPLCGAAPEFTQLAQAAWAAGADYVEWRLDSSRSGPLPDPAAFSEYFAQQLAQFTPAQRQRLVLTWRGVRDEGGHPLPNEHYQELLTQLGPLVGYIDVEFAWVRERPEILSLLRARGARPLVSAHDFHQTPAQLAACLQELALPGAAVIKLAVWPQQADDLGALAAAGQAWSALPANLPLILIGMGELGQDTRLYPQRYGSSATFATYGYTSAPGQLSLAALLRAWQNT